MTISNICPSHDGILLRIEEVCEAIKTEDTAGIAVELLGYTHGDMIEGFTGVVPSPPFHGAL